MEEDGRLQDIDSSKNTTPSEVSSNSGVIHSLSGGDVKRIFTMKTAIFFVIFLLLGIGTGYILSSKNISTKNITSGGKMEVVDKGKTVGSDDKKFKDQAEGVLKSGGIDGEGEYHLERPGGLSQNVYLTSSVLDLSVFIDKKVNVWGETYKAKKAGWLMDAGKVQLLE